MFDIKRCCILAVLALLATFPVQAHGTGESGAPIVAQPDRASQPRFAVVRVETFAVDSDERAEPLAANSRMRQTIHVKITVQNVSDQRIAGEVLRVRCIPKMGGYREVMTNVLVEDVPAGASRTILLRCLPFPTATCFRVCVSVD